jgi:hypothetical protein
MFCSLQNVFTGLAGKFIMGGMAVLEFFSIFLLSEQVSLKLFVSLACSINDTKARIDYSL